MDIVPILSTVILVATIITFIVAISAYLIFRIKEKRRHSSMHSITSEEEIARRLQEDITEETSAGSQIKPSPVVINVGTQPAIATTPAVVAPVMTTPTTIYQPQPIIPVQAAPASQTAAQAPAPTLTSPTTPIEHIPEPVAMQETTMSVQPAPQLEPEAESSKPAVVFDEGRPLSPAQSAFLKSFGSAPTVPRRNDAPSIADKPDEVHLRRFKPSDNRSGFADEKNRGGKTDWR